MKLKILLLILVCCNFFSCKKEKNNSADRFKMGAFEIPAGEGFGKTIIIRKDSLQIELYEDQIDSLHIKWLNNYSYTLKMLNPRKEIDNDPIHVKITSMKDKSCDFEARIGHSEFTSSGTMYIIEKEE